MSLNSVIYYTQMSFKGGDASLPFQVMLTWIKHSNIMPTVPNATCQQCQHKYHSSMVYNSMSLRNVTQQIHSALFWFLAGRQGPILLLDTRWKIGSNPWEFYHKKIPHHIAKKLCMALLVRSCHVTSDPTDCAMFVRS